MHFSHPIVIINEALRASNQENSRQNLSREISREKNCVPKVAKKTAPNHLRIQTLSNGKYLIIDTFEIYLSIEFYLHLYLRTPD